ncbi:MAG: hypothetical protein H6909_01435 [Rickettsiaceae bacterium]|nr:hypothetical protein [Rickettsiaceae bacterium]
MFNLKELEFNKIKAAPHLVNSEFYNFICQDIIERISSLKGDFKNILVINAPIHDKIQQLLIENFIQSQIKFENLYGNQLGSKKYDLIIFPFGLHWFSNVQIFLQDIKQLLTKNGIFIANFAGGGTLHNLRRKLIEVEGLCSVNHTPHIIPFIRFDDMVPLLQQAGYVENIIDMESLELIYDSPFHLMKDLKKYGDNNILTHRSFYSINKNMYCELKHKSEIDFTDYVNLITFISSSTKGAIKLL